MNSAGIISPERQVQDLIEDIKAAAFRGDRPRAERYSDELAVLVRAYVTPSIDGQWDGYGFTSRELAIVQFLWSKKGQVCLRTAIHEAVYYADPNGGADIRIIDVFMCRIREKLERAKSQYRIETYWGQGFKLCDGAGDRVIVVSSDGIGRKHVSCGGRPKMAARAS